MTTIDSDRTHALETWLDEGPSPTELPDAIYEAVMREVPAIRQRRSGWPGLSFPSRVLMARTGLAAAAIILAVWAGLNAPRGLDFSGVAPSPSTSVDAEQAAVRSTLRYWTGRQMPAGTYYVDEPFPMRIALTVPEGLEALEVVAGLAGVCVGSCDPQLAGLDFWIVDNGYADPCDVAAGIQDPAIGPTVDDLVEYVIALERVSVGEVADVTVGGYSGRYVELTTVGDVSDCSGGQLRLFYNNPGGIFFRPTREGYTDRLWVLDVEGMRLVIDVFSAAETPAEQVALLEAIVESIRVEEVGTVPPRTN